MNKKISNTKNVKSSTNSNIRIHAQTEKQIASPLIRVINITTMSVEYHPSG